MLNSVAQTLIKLTVPGVPDIYQGNELWRFDLVDPDNRRPVDYATRESVLREIRASEELSGDHLQMDARELSDNLEDGRIKIYTIWKALGLRRSQPDLFTQGDYAALYAEGSRANHVISYTRSFGDSLLIVVVPRLISRLLGGRGALPCGREIWPEVRAEECAAKVEGLLRAYLDHRQGPQESFQGFSSRHEPEALKALASAMEPA